MHLEIAGRDVVALAKKTLSEILDDNVLGLSAETAYSFFFGLFPAFLFAAPLLSLAGNKQQLFEEIFAWLAGALPPSALNLVEGVLRDVVFARSAPGLMSIGAVLSLYAGAGMFSSLMSALNDAYDVHDSRPWWEQKLIAIGATIGAVIVLGTAMGLLMGGAPLVRVVARAFHLGPAGEAAWSVLQVVLVIALVVGAIWAMYMVLPDVHAQDRLQVLVGAVFAAVLWLALSALLRTYVTHFGAYNRTYGTIGGVIVLLTWMYWSMFAILAGGELNSELRAGTGSRAIPKDRLAVPGRIQTHQGVPHPSSEIA